MTDPISSVAALPSVGMNYPTPADPQASEPTQKATRVVISRAEAAPVFVYRVLDNDTGRTLVEIPRESAANTSNNPGSVLDTWA